MKDQREMMLYESLTPEKQPTLRQDVLQLAAVAVWWLLVLLMAFC